MFTLTLHHLLYFTSVIQGSLRFRRLYAVGLHWVFGCTNLIFWKQSSCLRLTGCYIIFILFFFFFLLVFSIAGKANLERSDLEPALKALKDRLMTKNVVCSCNISFSIILLEFILSVIFNPFYLWYSTFQHRLVVLLLF